jgi:ribosome-associated protein
MPAPRHRYDEALESAPEGDEELRSRTDERRDNRKLEAACEALAKKLVELGPKQLKKLELPEPVLAAVFDARAIESVPARLRALKVVRKELRDADVAAIGERLERLHEAPAVKPVTPVSSWRERLLSEGEAAIESLVTEFPAADRRQLRTLLRNVQRAPEAQRGRALTALDQALRVFVRA